jgi:predicted Zn-dependent protease
MKYTPREITENVNISPTHPLKECGRLIAGITAMIILIYLLLGLAWDLLVARFPHRLEEQLSRYFTTQIADKERTPSELVVQKLVDELAQHLSESTYNFQVHIIESDTINALALPGGHIIIFSGLLKELESENELAMILAHEIGHYVLRHHLRAMGRGAVVAFISTMCFGSDHLIAQFMMNALLTIDLKYSRQQEAAADVFALNLLNAHYHHVGGATDFFHKLEKEPTTPRFLKFFLTHPFAQDRIQNIEKVSQEYHYMIDKLLPLPSSL